MAEERIQKILAKAGFGSRRACEEYLRAGRITVNGQVVELGAKADPAKDEICLDRKPVQTKTESIYIALNKPRQVLSAIHQDDDRKDVLALVPFEGHLFPVGRLDYDSEGLLLLTNDGDFANKLAHPRYEHEKEYIVQIGCRPDDEQLNTWRRGVVLEDGYRTQPAKVEVIETQPKSATLRITLREGRKRQIRESGERIGLPVRGIKRVRIGTILLGSLKTGEWRNLTRQEIVSMSKPNLSTTGKIVRTEDSGKPVTGIRNKPVAVWRGRKETATGKPEAPASRAPRTRKPIATDADGYSKPARPVRKRSQYSTSTTAAGNPEAPDSRAPRSRKPFATDADGYSKPARPVRKRSQNSTFTTAAGKPEAPDSRAPRSRKPFATDADGYSKPARPVRKRSQNSTGSPTVGKPFERSRRPVNRSTVKKGRG